MTSWRLRAQGHVANLARALGMLAVLRGLRAGYRRRVARRTFASFTRSQQLPRRFVAFGGHANGGIGDDLLCSAAAHELHRRTGEPVLMISRTPELFIGNAAVAGVLPPSTDLIELLPQRGSALANAHYWDVVTQGAPRHILTAMCRNAGVTGSVALRPYIFLSAEERARGRIAPAQVVIQATGAHARWPSINKEWYVERMAEVARYLSRCFQVIQLGDRRDPLLPETVDYRGRTTTREAAALLANSRCFVGLVGFPMHLARAVDCRAVIIFGGNETPERSGYPCNENLFTALPCAPCYRFTSCDFDRACMQAIQPQHVIAAVDRLLARDGPLETTIVPDETSTDPQALPPRGRGARQV